MCGIAGAFDLTGRREFPEECLLRMTGAMAHRGPNDEHLHREPGLALGVRRLSVIDVAHGRQPLCNEAGDVWVAFEGELYDYPEIRERLLAGAPAADPLRHRGLAPPLRGPRRKGVRSSVRPIRCVLVGPQPPHPAAGPRSRGHQPAVLCRGGRLAVVGFRNQELDRFRSARRSPGRTGHRLFLQLLLSADGAHRLRGRPLRRSGPFDSRTRRTTDAPSLLVSRFPRRRGGAPVRQPRHGRGGVGSRAARGDPAPPGRRGAAQLLHQRRTRFDRSAGVKLAGTRLAASVVHDRTGQVGPIGRARQGGGVRPHSRLEVDHRKRYAGRPHRQLPARHPRRGRAGAGHVLCRLAPVGGRQPQGGQHCRPHRRRGRRGAGRLRLVQVAPHPAPRQQARQDHSRPAEQPRHVVADRRRLGPPPAGLRHRRRALRSAVRLGDHGPEPRTALFP